MKHKKKEDRRDWSNHIDVNDSPEQIRMCLSCTREICVDCIGSINRTGQEPPKRMEEFDLSVLRSYPDAKSIYDLANLTETHPQRIRRSLERLSLPLPNHIQKKERENLAKMKRKELIPWSS